jgi:tetrapyrrole methylase family protein/MazG family protein
VTLLPSGETTTLQSVAADQSNAWDALLIPPLAPIEALASPWAMPWLSARLRAPDGCPWDREQTHLTLAKHLIEEAWELHDAIEVQAVAPSAVTEAAMAEELGDVYLQVVLHTQLAAERGAFDLTDVQERLAKKIIRRHPHVFGEATAETSREVQRAWESVKAEERAERGDASPKSKSALSGVSRGLPALSASRELQDRASAMGYDWPTLDGVREKFTEEIQELTEALEAAGNPDSITGRGATSAATLAAAQDELGDVMAVLVNLGRRSGIDAEAALRGANEKFRRRFGEVERRAAERKIDLKTADFATLDTLWDEAKAAERAGALDSKS